MASGASPQRAVRLRGAPDQLVRTVIRVLVADDQALVRGGFRMILEAQKDIDVIAEAERP